jgi:hypothetical protein
MVGAQTLGQLRLMVVFCSYRDIVDADCFCGGYTIESDRSGTENRDFVSVHGLGPAHGSI